MSIAPPDRQLHAAAFMICAMAVIGVIDNFIAPLSRHIGLWQFHLMRAAIAWPLVAVLVLILKFRQHRQIPPFPQDLPSQVTPVHK